MKFLAFLLSVILCLSFSVNAFAEDFLNEVPEVVPDEPIEGTYTQPENEYLNMVLDNMQSDIDTLNEKVEVLEDDVSAISESNSVSDTPVENVISEETEINPETDLPVSVELLSVAPITPEDTSGLKAVLLSVIGDYDPVVVEYEL